MANATVYLVTLTEGASFTTPWGKRMRGGSAVTVANPEHLTYFHNSGRFKVDERRERQRSASGRGRSGPRSVPVTPQRQLALAKARVHKDMKKASLLALCRDLGVRGVVPNDTRAMLVPKIQARQAEILKEHEPDAEEAKKAAAEAADKAKAAKEAEEASIKAAEEAEEAAMLAEAKAAEEAEAEAENEGSDGEDGDGDKSDK